MAKYKIRNKKTGETKTVGENQLSSFGLSPMVSKEEKQEEQRKPQGFLQKIAEGIGGEARETAQSLGAALGMKRSYGGFQKSSQKALQRSRELINRAKQTEDKEEKQRLLKLSRQIDRGAGQATRKATVTPAEVGFEPGEIDKETALGQGLESTAQLSRWLVPAGSAEGIGVTEGTKFLAGEGVKAALGRAAVEGGLESVLSELGTEKKDMNTLPSGVLFSIGLTGGGRIAKGLWDNLFDTLPTTLRERNLKIFENTGERSYERARKLAKESLEKGAPGSYKKMRPWAEDIEKKAEQEIRKLADEGTEFTAGSVFSKADDPFIQERVNMAYKEMLETANTLGKRGSFKRAKEVGQAAEKFANTGKLDLQDWINVKRGMDQLVNQTFNKAAKDISSDSLVRKRVTADKIRDFLRRSDDVSKGVRDLLDTQQMAIVTKNAIEPAQAFASRRTLPSWWELSAGGAPLAYGAGAETAAVPLGAIAIERLLRRPGASKTLHGIGQAGKTAGKKLPSNISQRLRNFLVTGALAGEE